MAEKITFLRTQEAQNLLASEPDIITQRLMIAARFFLGSVLHTEGKSPVGDFDLLFFMQILQAFCSEHEILQRILNGEEASPLW